MRFVGERYTRGDELRLHFLCFGVEVARCCGWWRGGGFVWEERAGVGREDEDGCVDDACETFVLALVLFEGMI